MKNIDRLTQYIAKNGPASIMVHTIPKTNNWVIAQKIEKDKWMLTLCNPMGNVTYNLGTCTSAQHLHLWGEIVRMEIENKTSQMLIAKNLKNKIYKFTKSYENDYEKFIKRELKRNRSKCNKKVKRSN